MIHMFLLPDQSIILKQITVVMSNIYCMSQGPRLETLEDIQACKNSQSNIINLYFRVILNFIFIIYIFLPYLLTFTIFDF